ncbi:MAG: precorrin-6B methylase [Lachnospiraceae bacterium]|nr:precorrin-6B methylase [Lachnospiraceae bacterium]
MEQQIFTNEVIISWLQYYAKNTTLDLEHVKIIDITRKNKNVIPTVEAHKTTMVFTNAGIDDIFYRLWNAGLGDCEVWYNEGSDPSGEILHQKVKDMIDRGINASAGMLIVNPNARNTTKIGLSNEMFQRGSIHYVGSEIRAIILNKMMVAPQDDICVIGGESIAIEAALMAPEGSVIAVEYSKADRATLEDNVAHFDLHNVKIIDHVDAESMKDCPVPSLVFLVASASTDQELAYLTKISPNISVVIYTLDFKVAAELPNTLQSLGITDIDTIQVSVSKLGSNNTFKQEPAPWIITGRSDLSNKRN